MASDPLARLEKLAQVAGEGLASVSDVASALHAVTNAFGDHVKPLFKRMSGVEDDIADHKLRTGRRFLQVEANASKSAGDLERKISGIALTPGPQGRPGRDAVGAPGPAGRDGSPDTAAQIAEKLSAFEEPWLSPSAIEGFDELAHRVEVVQPRPIFGVPSRGLFLYVGGVKKGIISNLNLIGGSGVSIAYSKVNSQDTITINASGSGITVFTPVETVDASRTTFAVPSEPKWMVADGTTYYEGAGYSYSTDSVTFDIAPSEFVRAII